ncbi:effector-associated domain EAD1-containing protein [Candidatus Frankia nodulisporulans]|uniref:effector-associated domain EAD1-containing protein n=1 Tax=Candidatus Frankia nodulisporulans TaxID=2060052 RepID=UPI0013D22C00|nr:effector-associated domain EAD1-containing protein [Candidatus Frankia nodulisporulans]
MTQRLTEAEIKALATVFDTRRLAVQVLEDAGLRRDQTPVFDGSSHQFWTEIAHLLHNGILENGRVCLLAAAAKKFPDLSVFQPPSAFQPTSAMVVGAEKGSATVGSDSARGGAPGASRHANLFRVDASGYSKRDLQGQLDVRAGVRGIVDTALDRAGVADAVLLHENGGDGCLCALDANVSRDLLASDFVRELRIAQRQFNRVRAPSDQVRLRLSLHHGQIVVDGGGAAGDAVVVVDRLVNAMAVRAILDSYPAADLVLALSPDFYRDTVAEGLRDLDPADFALFPAVVDAKYVGEAWVTLPGHRANPPMITQPPHPAAQPRPAPQPQARVVPQPQAVPEPPAVSEPQVVAQPQAVVPASSQPQMPAPTRSAAGRALPADAPVEDEPPPYPGRTMS